MINFDKSMQVGVKLIDEQHRELISRLNAFVQGGVSSYTKDETERMLDSLGSYINKHFTDEKKLHADSNYPEAGSHKELHKIYVNEFNELRDEYRKNGVSAKFTLKLTNSLIGWIVKHIKSADMKFGKFKNGG